MTRRAIVAVVLSVLGWALLGTVASATGGYPPVPGTPEVAKVQDAAPAEVRGAPARPRQALSRTGTSSTVPLVALGVGLVVLGAVVLGGSRRNRLGGLPSHVAAP